MCAHMIYCYKEQKIFLIEQKICCCLPQSKMRLQPVAIFLYFCSLITILSVSFIFFSDHYFTWLTWVTDNRVGVQWLKRIQNFSVLAICDFKENSNTWVCPEVIKLEIYVAGISMCYFLLNCSILTPTHCAQVALIYSESISNVSVTLGKQFCFPVFDYIHLSANNDNFFNTVNAV